jgi:hypothetical protein
MTLSALDAKTKKDNLKFLTDNRRFLILPWERVPCRLKIFTFTRLQKDFGRFFTSSGWIARKGERWEEIDSMECHHGTYCPYLNGEDVFSLLQ